MSKAQQIESIAAEIVDAAVKVHRQLGPGLLESAYRRCHSYELRKRGLKLRPEIRLPIKYDGITLDAGYRIDAWVEGLVIIEHKTVRRLLPIHEAQLLTYLRLTGCTLGFLLNWYTVRMKQGIKRMVLNHPEDTHFKQTIEP